ncbi:MAG: DUF1028 domain-containing protein [Ignavibacteria bacterium]
MLQKIFLIVIILGITINTTRSQDTFSITAVDLVTGEVGSAAASCVANCIILCDIHPGKGIIHTQASWNQNNQNYARTLMNKGYSPQQIIDSLVAHDAQNNPTIRQYGITDIYFGTARTAAYTGVNCQNYKNHIIGTYYTIQGNILLGQSILDSMEARFLNTSGSLAQRLMAALQGAKKPGADTRCAPYNKSAISAFLRVAKPGDTLGLYYCNLIVNNTPTSKDPIDSLQVLFNNWLLTNEYNYSAVIPEKTTLHQNYPNPFNPSTNIKFEINKKSFVKLSVYNVKGEEIAVLVDGELNEGIYNILFEPLGLSSGIYFYRLITPQYTESRRMLLIK